MLENQRTDREMVAALPGTLVLMLFLILFPSGNSSAKVTGVCSDCHTMHNSQNGTAMATYGGGTGPYGALTRGDCFGCHGQGTANNIVNIGGSEIPQVYHTDSSDLAAGNFKYIDTADNRGHNVIELNNNDDVLDAAPGLLPESGHDMIIKDTNLTCAGRIGCHGKRVSGASGISSLKGSHHQNVDGQCDTADQIYNSYRFLLGVKGYENMGTYKYQNYNQNNHNEYFGANTPMSVSCSNTCHLGPDGAVKPPNNTISGFCATCHGRFHDLASIGGDTSSPFTRHPTDIVIKNEGEYSAYTTYSVEAPVARPSVPDSISNVVTPGTDIVMCLSCHGAHATNYPDMLRWDYTTMIAGDTSKSGGCFTCHTQKNQ